MRRIVLVLAALALLADRADARVLVVRGSVSFSDGDPTVAMGALPPTLGAAFTRVGRRVRVEVHRRGDVVGVGHTDSRGRFAVAVDVPNDVGLSVVLEAHNRFARVWADTDCVNESLQLRFSGFSSGSAGDLDVGDLSAPLDYRTIRVGECLTTAYHPIVAFSAALNINEVIQASWDDVDRNRDPAEDDVVEQVYVEYCDEAWNHYFSDLVLTCFHSDENSTGLDSGYVDSTVVHEFGHHLQYEIGTWDGHSGSHSLCTENDTDLWNDPEFAWSEGWPNYLAAHMVAADPQMTRVRDRQLEHACGTGGSGATFVDPDDDERWISVEGHVGAVLWDLADGLGSQADAWDLVDGRGDGHRRILQIFDRELDPSGPYAFWEDAPDFRDFYRTWVGRTGRDSPVNGQPMLDLVANRVGIVAREWAVHAGGVVPVQKAAPLAFVEPAPLVPPGGRSIFHRDTLGLDLHLSWRFGEPAPAVVVRAGVSNLARGNTLTLEAAAASGQANAATFDATSVAYTPAPPTPWLDVRRDGTSSPAAGAITPGRLSALRFALVRDALLDLPRGTHQAQVDVGFALSRIDGGTTDVDRPVRVVLTVTDTALDDRDRDGIPNAEEAALAEGPDVRYRCLDYADGDSDDDGLSDGEEIEVWGTLPCSADSDGDGYDDFAETRASCFRPRIPDTAADPEGDPDGDGVANQDELRRGTDPCSGDSDGDGVLDGVDVCPRHSDPDQRDTDGDGVGNRCDRDDDGDGVPDIFDADPEDPEVGEPDWILDLVAAERAGWFQELPRLGFGACDPRLCDPLAGLLAGGRPRSPSCAGGCSPRVDLLDDGLRLRGRIADLGFGADSGLGAAVLSVPDLDGDARPDLAVSAPLADGDGGGMGGVVVLVSRSTLREITRLDGPAGSRFGAALARLGDEWLAVGAPGDTTRRGEVHLFSLPDLATREVIAGEAPGDAFGAALLSIAGKAGAAGRLVVGAPGARQRAGGLFLLAGPGQARKPIAFGDTGDRLGTALARGADAGTPSVLAGAPGTAAQAGAARLFAIDGSLRWSVRGGAGGDRLGEAVFAVEDASGRLQGYWVGAPGADGEAGMDTGGAAFVLPIGQATAFVSGARAGEAWGAHLAVGPDLDGDGIESLVLGALDSNTGERRSWFLERRRPELACQDGRDNDGDGLIDWDGAAWYGQGVPLAEPDPPCIERPWAGEIPEPAPLTAGLAAAAALAWLARSRVTRRRGALEARAGIEPA